MAEPPRRTDGRLGVAIVGMIIVIYGVLSYVSIQGNCDWITVFDCHMEKAIHDPVCWEKDGFWKYNRTACPCKTAPLCIRREENCLYFNHTALSQGYGQPFCRFLWYSDDTSFNHVISAICAASMVLGSVTEIPTLLLPGIFDYIRLCLVRLFLFWCAYLF